MLAYFELKLSVSSTSTQQGYTVYALLSVSRPQYMIDVMIQWFYMLLMCICHEAIISLDIHIITFKNVLCWGPDIKS
jgi:hypothetical protein